MTSQLETYKYTNFTNCPSESSYLETPEFLLRTVHIIAFVSFPMNLFGFYCILFKTPGKMNEMKWCLLNLQFWTCLLDVNYLLLLVPFYFLPLTAVGYIGVLSKLGVFSEIQYYLEVIPDGGFTAALIMLFENRHHALVPHNNIFRVNKPIIRVFLAIMNFFLGSTTIIPTLLLQNNTDEVKLKMLETTPCPDKLFFDSNTFAIEEKTDILSYLLSIGTVIIFLEGGFYVLHCIYHVRKWKNSTGGWSVQGRKMQKTLFIASCIQTLIPILLVTIPTLYTSFTMMEKKYSQATSNFITLTFSIHGTIATVALVVVNKPYRDFVSRLLRIRKPKPFSYGRTSTLIVPVAPKTSKARVSPVATMNAKIDIF